MRWSGGFDSPKAAPVICRILCQVRPTFDPVFLRGYVTRLTEDERTRRPVIDLEMLCPPGLSGAPVIRENRRDVIGVAFEEKPPSCTNTPSSSGARTT
jgi:hypothetical protein